ncbi:MAG: TonB family protein [Gemmatimonadaceae bacterium]
MTPILFAYVLLFTLLIAGAAAAIEWALQGRVGARHVWTAAIVIALVAPAAAITWHTVAARSVVPADAARGLPMWLSPMVISLDGNSGGQSSLWHGIIESLGAAWTQGSAILSAWSGWGPRSTTIVLCVWLSLSLALVLWLALGILRWRAARQLWERTTLDGIDVEVSPSTGPAVLGFLSHRIVVPAWATKMEPEHRRLILAHEGEHIDAHDPERLAFAIAAIVLMPWNITLWACAARLRRAIELDCDARVLKRFPGTREYGYVLLEVAARGRSTGPLAVPMVGLLRLPSELERRLVAMTRKRTPGYRAVVGGGLAAVAAVTVAFASPVPVAQVQPDSLAVPAATAAPASHRVDRLVLDTVPKARTKQDTLTAHQRDSVGTIERERAGRRAAVQKAQSAVQAAQTELEKRQTELNAAKARAMGSAAGTSGNANVTYFAYQVEKPAATLSGAPIYPPTLRGAGVEGEVDAEFTVDTTGRLDPSAPIKIIKSTNDLFKSAVMKALPEMRFAPAEIGGRKVRQLVQQPFTFTTIH